MTACTTYRKIVSGEAHGLHWDLARGVLRVLSVPYGMSAGMAEIYRSGQGGVRVDLPVFSIGNLTCGGTGKTPLVSMLVSELLERGRRPVILSRGYKAEADGQNDEARVLASAHPGVVHLQARDRVELAKRADHARLGDSIVLDDGFQYQRLHRDMNVCVLDATSPFGHGALLPRGLLREPVSSLCRARPVVISRAELVTDERIDEIKAAVRAVNEHAKIIVSEMRLTTVDDVHGEASDKTASLRGASVMLASGIGNPEAFERGVRTLGARVVRHQQMDDHHAWSDADVKALARTAQDAGASAVITTVKDAVKLERLAWPEGAPALRSVGVEVAMREGDDAGLWKTLVDETLKGR